MGKRFLHTISSPLEDLTASTNPANRDLPVNPLSVVFLNLELTRAAPAALDTFSAIDDAIDAITSVQVLHKGEQIVAGSLRDVMVLNAVAFHAFPSLVRRNQASGAIDNAIFPICLGRRPYDPDSCFPATSRGNLVWHMEVGAFAAGITDLDFSLETLELIEATPKEHVKYTTSSRTSVAGQFEADLPIGNSLLGVLLFDTGLNANATALKSWGQLRLKKDNVEQLYASTDIEVLAGMLGAQLRGMHVWPGHVHQFDGAAVGLDMSDESHMDATRGFRGYAWMDFDPLHDYSYELETAGAADLVIQAVGDEATAIRWLPLERVILK